MSHIQCVQWTKVDLCGHGLNKHSDNYVLYLYIMCNDCCKEFTGWCKAFTKTEVFLCVLQVISLVVLIAFLMFLILHLVDCSRNKLILESPGSNQTDCNANSTHTTAKKDHDNDLESSTNAIATENTIYDDHDQNDTDEILFSTITLDERVKCTWQPSQKTNALTHYYDNIQTTDTVADHEVIQTEGPLKEDNELLKNSNDGEEIHDSRKGFLLALVKIKPPQDVTFGCTLTVVTEYWTVTAASCIEAIEEVDSLDSFVMMQGFKEENQRIHPVADVMLHPQYEGKNLTYDLAALKSETSLLKKGGSAVVMPSMIDYFLITIGEKLTILGYGRFRNIDKDPLTRSARAVAVHAVPPAQCPARADTWARRHLVGGAPLPHGACGTSPICAGVLRSRTSPCNYCSGTPLLDRNVLLGIMSDNQHCGLSCEPALFVNLASAREWLSSVITN